MLARVEAENADAAVEEVDREFLYDDEYSESYILVYRGKKLVKKFDVPD